MSTAIKERPILFSTDMVRAILEGRKTQTRRVVKPQPPSVEAVKELCGSEYHWFTDRHLPDWRVAGPVWAVRQIMGMADTFGGPVIKCPYGVPGDRMWVRETWDCETHKLQWIKDTIRYRATDESGRKTIWRPSIHMPRWASRLTLEVTEVRVERLQDISEDDAEAEGVPDDLLPIDVSEMPYPSTLTHGAFAALWNQVSGKHPWSSNPWVWVITFTKVECSPEDSNE